MAFTYTSQHSTNITVNHFSWRRNELSLTVFFLFLKLTWLADILPKKHE